MKSGDPVPPTRTTSRLPIADMIPGSAGGRPEQSSLFSTLLDRGPVFFTFDQALPRLAGARPIRSDTGTRRSIWAGSRS